MPLFQTSVQKKYLQEIDQNALEVAWNRFSKYFLDPDIQKGIRSLIEEKYQEGFLSDLFVDVLGYTKHPNLNFNLTTELKNVKDSKKTDGAILKDGEALAVIELKGTNTVDLSKVESQAFGYKNNQPECVYVITSNFEKLRFYIDNAIEHEEFDLFNLTRDRFEILWICLSANCLLKGVPKQIKDESLKEEENVTKKLYKEYSLFRNELFADLQKRNLQYDPLTLFNKTQKLLDRFLFIFFAEDRLLLPPNSIREIARQWDVLKEMDAYVPLYDRYKKYFGYMNTGYKGKKHDIFAYNGGLFFPDEVLDNIEIDDDLLHKHTVNLSNYDFESEVSVNILGHIFEHSLSEIENVQAQLEGKEVEKSKTKRKKDGVFYTPKYITKYIVDNTVGKLCAEKKEEIGLDEKEYYTERAGRWQKTLKALLKKLDDYREWLLTIAICDPACGSGAFLNQTLEFLIEEHHFIDTLKANLLGGGLVFSEVENSILEHNLFGVDINEESVEIAKLSLWLRTAKKGRKLSSLNNNIKCGNSLIDDPEVAGDKAFKWEGEFPDIFSRGGFDVVVGNPPYVRQELLGDFKPFFKNEYEVFQGTADLFTFFYEKSFDILKPNGLFGFISNTFDKTKAALKLRSFLTRETSLTNYIDFTEVQIFEGATTYPIILIAENCKSSSATFQYTKISKNATKIDLESNPKIEVTQQYLLDANWSFRSNQAVELLLKITQNPTVRHQFKKCFYGIKTGYNDAFIIDKNIKKQLEKEHASSSELIKPFFEGKDMNKWRSADIEKYLIFTRRGTRIEEFPAIKEYLEQFRERLTPRNSPDQKIGRKPGKYKWFEIQDSVDYFKIFEGGKITWPNLQSTNKFSIDEEGYYINAPSVVLASCDKALLSILNSKLVWYFLTNICVVRSGGYIEVKPQYFEQIPIPVIKNPKPIEVLTEQQIIATSMLQRKTSKFLNRVQGNLRLQKVSKKMTTFYDYNFKTFVVELKKQKLRLSLSDQDEWEEYFNQYKSEINKLQTEIDKTDREIDQMVYELYGLTEEEIEIVENSVN